MLPLLGIFDAGYLTWQHYGNILAPCPAYFTFIDCGQVLRSSYSALFGVPLALLGLIFYSIETILAAVVFIFNRKILRNLLLITSLGGFLFSLYLIYIQLYLIHAVCLYCMGSALISTLFFAVMIAIVRLPLKKS
jgi:uncharacterized membrane protein